MSFNINFNRSKNKVIRYNFPSTPIYKNDITNTINSPYIVSFIPTSKDANIIYTPQSNSINYYTQSVYFYPLLHNNIIGVDYNSDIIGEFIIKASTQTSPDPIFMCFLLKKKSTSDVNDIDKFFVLKNSDTEYTSNIILNNSIPKQDHCITFNDDNNTVLIFTTPITVNASTSQILAGNAYTTYSKEKSFKLFSLNTPTNYEVINNNNINVESFENRVIEPFSDDQLYIKCQPTGESQNTIETYNIPINSEMSAQQGEMNYAKTTVNFFIFMLALLFCYTVVPVVYKLTVIDRLNKSYGNSDQPEKVKKNISIDALISLGFIFLTLNCFKIGYSTNNYYVNTIGILIIVLYLLSYSIIQIRKNGKGEFLETIGCGNSKITMDYIGVPIDIIESINETGKTFMQWITILFEEFFTFFFFTAIYLVVIVILYVINSFYSSSSFIDEYSTSIVYIYYFSILLLSGIIPIFHKTKDD